ncbi:sulfurtransferase TusD [Cellvibrio zantedeschiae]|uniref:Sulfur carrier protein TusA n=1 Tax=Cellvibrio zantedeschiae TaxID=1237077 RepID=A0ABQ3AVD2_9GAMM|nr:sulfurtransferase TusA [Cellvibrio zantedeschiae]GGY68000.1 sulfurtransferase TusD [Cellvibrio zantedeschiae]
MNSEIDKILDTSGLLCPEPVMMLHKAVKDLADGGVIKVIATDPSTTRDIPKFCHFLGYELIKQEADEKSYFYYIKKISA